MVMSDSIEGTINFGIKISKKFFFCILLCWTIMAFSCLIPVILYSCAVVEIVNVLNIEGLWGLIGFTVVFFVADIITLTIYIRQYYFFKHRINKFLNDSLLLETKARIYEFSTSGFGPYTIYKVVAVFSYDGKEMKIIGKKYCKQFKKFIGEEVKIFYSPSYDEVMFLKDSNTTTK